MSETIYRVGSKASVLGPRGTTTYLPGDIVPVKEVFANQPGRVEELLISGHLTTEIPVLQERDGAKEAPVIVGPWRVHPNDTADKTLEQLHLMILEIDALQELPETVEEARELLSIDYHPDPD